MNAARFAPFTKWAVLEQMTDGSMTAETIASHVQDTKSLDPVLLRHRVQVSNYHGIALERSFLRGWTLGRCASSDATLHATSSAFATRRHGTSWNHQCLAGLTCDDRRIGIDCGLTRGQPKSRQALPRSQIRPLRVNSEE